MKKDRFQVRGLAIPEKNSHCTLAIYLVHHSVEETENDDRTTHRMTENDDRKPIKKNELEHETCGLQNLDCFCFL